MITLPYTMMKVLQQEREQEIGVFRAERERETRRSGREPRRSARETRRSARERRSPGVSPARRPFAW